MLNNPTLYTAYTETTRMLSAYCTIGGVRVSTDDRLSDFKLNQKADKDGVWIGSVIPTELKMTLIKDGLTASLAIDTEIIFYHGVQVGGAMTYQKLGKYYIYSVESKEDSKTVTVLAYDRLKKAQETPMTGDAYPITVTSLLAKACALLGVSYTTTNLIFGSYSIPSEIYYGANKTVSDVIRAIAQANMTFAIIDIDGRLVFRRVTETSKTIATENMFKWRLKGKQGPINAIVLSRQPQNDDVALRDEASITANGLNELKVINNPILDIAREGRVTAALNAVKGVSYTGVETLTMQANPLFEIGDYVTVEGEKTLILEHEITLTRSTIKCAIPLKTETDYSKAKGVDKQVVEANLTVDKLKGEIVAEVTRSKKAETDLTTELGKTNTQVTNQETRITQNEKDIKLKASQTSLQTLSDKVTGENGLEKRVNVVETSEFVLNATTQKQRLEKVETKATTNATNIASVTTTANAVNTVIGSFDTSGGKTIAKALTEINATADGITQTVTSINDGFKSIVTQTANSYTVRADKIDLQGLVNIINSQTGTTTQIDGGRIKTGSITTDQIKIIDKIEASRGTIGGFTIDGNTLFSGSGDDYIRIASTPGFDRFRVGGSTWETAIFAVSSKGAIKATAGTIGGWEISPTNLRSKKVAGRGQIDLHDGSQAGWALLNVTDSAGNSTFKVMPDGSFSASSGTIANWTVIGSTIKSEGSSGFVKLNSAATGWPMIEAGKGASTYFKVLPDGHIEATGATISGNITATSGTIGGFTIGATMLSGGSGSNYMRFSVAPGAFRILAGGETWDTASFAVSSVGAVKATDITLTRPKGTSVNFAGTHTGSHSGYGSFSDGSYTGSGYLSYGTLGGSSYSNKSSNTVSIANISSSTLSCSTLYFVTLQSTERNSSGYSYNAKLQNGAWVISNSDIRLKENIEELGDEFNDVIYSMPLIKYTYKSDEAHTPQVGVNANFISKWAPDYFAKSFVHQDKITGLYGANYEKLVPYLIMTIQDLNKRVKELESA